MDNLSCRNVDLCYEGMRSKNVLLGGDPKKHEIMVGALNSERFGFYFFF